MVFGLCCSRQTYTIADEVRFVYGEEFEDESICNSDDGSCDAAHKQHGGSKKAKSLPQGQPLPDTEGSFALRVNLCARFQLPASLCTASLCTQLPASVRNQLSASLCTAGLCFKLPASLSGVM